MNKVIYHYETLTLLAFIVMVWSCNAQPRAADVEISPQTIRQQAMAMSQALIKRDVETFISFHHPKIMKLFESPAKAKLGIAESWRQNDADSIWLVKNIIGTPSKVVFFNDEHQCTIPQTFEYKARGALVTIKSTLIGISEDNGKKWYFLDASTDNMKKLRTIFPDLSPELIISEQEKPVIVYD